MLYYTQVIYIKESQEEMFYQFEERVLPLLKKHNGQLLYRVRPTADAVIESGIGNPHEIHLVSFGSRKDFEAYRDDKERLQYMDMKDRSVEKSLLIEGKLL